MEIGVHSGDVCEGNHRVCGCGRAVECDGEGGGDITAEGF